MTEQEPISVSEESAQQPQSIFRNEIRLDLVFKSIAKRRRLFVVPLIVTLALMIVIMYSLPRYYSVTVKLAPESSSGGMAGSMSDIASMVGVNLNSMSSEDAIVPLFYPDLIQSTDFIVPLLYTKVKTQDGKFHGSYLDYLSKAQKMPWWGRGVDRLKKLVKKTKPEALDRQRINPFQLTKAQNDVVELAGSKIKCTVDKKTDVITLSTTAQDPLVAALMADTVLSRLQQFIIVYRTKKAKNDLAHYQLLLKKATSAYEAAQKRYAGYADANQDVVLASYRVKEERLENELQLAYNNYSGLKNQVQVAEAKVMEKTPAFTVIQNASVPVRPAGPKRVLTILAALVFCVIFTAVYIVARDKSLTL